MRRFSKEFWTLFLVSLSLTIGSALWSVTAAAQANNAGHGDKYGSNATKKEEIKFEVISIRPVKPGWSPYDGGSSHLSDFNPTPSGFISTLTVWQMIMIAYAPSDQSWDSIPLINAPKWLYNYDAAWFFINARVSEADMRAWQNQSIHHELLRSAMQNLLKERCKLVIHKQPGEFSDYRLVIGKKGLKMKVTPPGSALPKGTDLKSGGVMVAEGPRNRTTWHFHGATIEDLVEFLGRCSPNRPVHDGTGLTGRYDFAMQMIEIPSRDHEEQIYNWPVAPLGLDLKPGKYPGFKLIIDHLERPSSND